MSKTTTKEPELFEPEKPAAQAKPQPKSKKLTAPAPTANLPAERARPLPAIAQEPSSLYAAIIEAARDPKVDAEKMRTLVELQIQVEKWEAQKSFTRAFNALQAELPTIDKDGLIDHGEGRTARGNEKLKTKFSTYPNLMGVCRPLLRKHGFTFNNIIEPTPDGARIVVVGYLTHIDGHAMASRFPLGADAGPGRSNAQAWGSATSYGKRYNLILSLDIVSEAPQDQDNDGFARRTAEPKEDAAPQTISKAQAEELKMTLADAKLPEERFCEKYGITAVEDLGSKQLAEAKKSIAEYKRRAADAKKPEPKNG